MPGNTAMCQQKVCQVSVNMDVNTVEIKIPQKKKKKSLTTRRTEMHFTQLLDKREIHNTHWQE